MNKKKLSQKQLKEQERLRVEAIRHRTGWESPVGFTVISIGDHKWAMVATKKQETKIGIKRA